ncbi:DNA end-binding protein Ku [Archaeoglobus sulfaticallidus PM70-1]|uniref:Non-homologous end joining protein Ku n=1 Tax=Archaeoglobus sulfaticallidus PM70-1 TaxID=387631 RepID=N0BD65_9EURY|nr:Ku protein [Archaeoglobus sulfaticallidus]AGK61544.1 DNA end-binding protein Ku [Archaeoglobus sulfaticallidus PM70-1]
MKAVWKGSISFGLVNVPIKLYTSTLPKDVEFKLLHREDGGRVRYKRVCEKCGKELGKNDIVKGYEISKDEYVLLTDEDFEKIPLKTTKTIQIRQFFSPEELGVVFYNGFYYISPEKGSERAYYLLRRAMEETNSIGIGKVTMRNKENLVAVRPYDGGLILVQLHFLEEIRNPMEVPFWGKEEDITEEEIELAKKLILAMKKPLRIEEFVDEYKNALLELINAKIEGREVKVSEELEEVKSLIEALKESLEVIES